MLTRGDLDGDLTVTKLQKLFYLCDYQWLWTVVHAGRWYRWPSTSLFG